MPVKVVLGTRRKAKGLGAKCQLVEVEDSFMYVPILETLQTLLNNQTVLEEVRFVCIMDYYILLSGIYGSVKLDTYVDSSSIYCSYVGTYERYSCTCNYNIN